MKELRFYRRLIRMNLLSALEYKGWWMMVLQVLLVVVTDPIGTVLLFSRFGSIGVWSVERILLVYSLSVTSYGLAESFFRGFDYFPWHILRTGNFDRLMLRPRSLFTQTAAYFFHIHRFARPAAGLAVIAWSLARQNIPPSPRTLLLLASALIGGTLVYTGVFVMCSGIAFFSVKALDIFNLQFAGLQVSRVPVEYMPRLLWGAFTFLLPAIMVSYYPASVLCGWGEPTWRGLLALPVGAAFFSLSLLVWRVGVRHYQSTGS